MDSGLSGIILDESVKSQQITDAAKEQRTRTNKTNWSQNETTEEGEHFETQSLEGLSQSLSSVATISKTSTAGGGAKKKQKVVSSSASNEEPRKRSRDDEDLARSWAVSSPALSAPPNLSHPSNYETDQNSSRMVLKQLPR